MNIQKLMQQAQKAQKDAEKMEKELAETLYEGVAGGAVKISMKGSFEVVAIDLADETLEDKEMLIDMLEIALNEVITKINSDREEKMASLTQGLSIPGVL